MLRLFWNSCCSWRGNPVFQNTTWARTKRRGNGLVLKITTGALPHKHLYTTQCYWWLFRELWASKALFWFGVNKPKAAAEGQPGHCQDFLFQFTPVWTPAYRLWLLVLILLSPWIQAYRLWLPYWYFCHQLKAVFGGVINSGRVKTVLKTLSIATTHSLTPGDLWLKVT